MSYQKKLPKYEIVDGTRLCGQLSHNAFRSALGYQPKPEDIFVVTYPKCGTTWTQWIVLHILRKGKPLQEAMDFYLASPYLEMTGADAIDIMTRPGVIKTHLSYDMIPYLKQSKYIYVARNPKDCLISFYYHTKVLTVMEFQDGKFDDFFEIFLKGEVEYGDFFDHLLPWYEHRHDPNVLFLTYEDMKKDIRNAIYKIAEFISEEYKEMLYKNPNIMDNIIKYTSIDYMKNHMNKFTEDYFGDRIPKDSPIPSGIKEFKNNCKSLNQEGIVKGYLVRKGMVGDWKIHLNPEQDERINKWIKEKTSNSNVMDIWKDNLYF